MRLGLLLSEIGRQNNIQVPNEDLNRAIVTEARRFPGQEKQVIDYYQQHPEAGEPPRADIRGQSHRLHPRNGEGLRQAGLARRAPEADPDEEKAA